MQVRYLLLFSICLFAAGCTVDLSQVDGTQSPVLGPAITYANWTGDDTIQFKQQLVTIGTHQELFNITKVASTADIQIRVSETEPFSVHDWQEITQSKLAINGSYFDELDQLVTRTVANAVSYGPLLSKSTGILGQTESGWGIYPWQGTEPVEFQDYLQSYPMLISGGKIVFTGGTSDTAQRSVVANDAAGNIYFIVAEYGVLTLSQLAEALLQLEDVALEEALNLDGGTSTGMAVLAGDVNFVENSLAVPSAILVF